MSRPQQISVAIVDDDEVDLFIAQRVVRLKFETENIALFRSGFEFMEKFKDPSAMDVILLNYRMPEKSGLNVLDDMPGILPNSKPFVIITSTSLDPGDLARIKAHPKVDFFIPKPILPAHIKKVIELLLSTKQH
ncbi:MAG: two-component system response regulator [Cryomorphaceae bacterium]